MRKVYIPLHKEREQEAREEKSHYVQMVTFSWGCKGQMSISQKNVNPSLGKETESRISDSRSGEKKNNKNFRRVEYQIRERIKIKRKILRGGTQKWKSAIKFDTSH